MHFNAAVRYIVAMKFVYAYVAACLALVTTSNVVAQDRMPRPERSKAIQPSAMLKKPQKIGAGISVRQAIALAQRNTGGRVLSSKTFNGVGQNARVHQIRLLVEDERVVTVIVDAGGRVRRR